MRKSYYIELLAGIEAGMIGVLIALLHKWYLTFLVGFFGFVLFSFLIGKLKEETLKEYLRAVKEAKMKGK